MARKASTSKASAPRPQPVRVGSVQIGQKPLVLILGPCVMESPQFTRRMAQNIQKIVEPLGLPWIFKASYDKANRSSVKSFRGPGVREGGILLQTIRRELGVPVTTDVHNPEEAKIAGEHVDLLQIPAFLCRQTDLLVAAAQTGRSVNVKKGQFMSPWEIGNILGKLEANGCTEHMITERGTTFGYQNLVADMRSIVWMKEAGARAVVFDATHSVQRPGGGGDHTSGDGYLAPILARAAVAAGCDAVFLETHEQPSKALSDGPNQVPLKNLEKVLRDLRDIRKVITS
ncbi:MAG: 3-deoxy-8-phosphooctulonate synthase [Verrucomicrobiales bacterium]